MKKKKYFKFSVIMCIYNVEDYLDEAIQSIINQDIGFEENIQLILVNDGSPDNSKEICLKYKKMYSKNIVYHYKRNGGLASAKNCGLNYVRGKYISFFDSDDKLPTNVFSEVFRFFENNELCVDMVTIPLYFFGAESGLHPKYNYMGKKNRIINLIEEPYNFILSGAASFYKIELFKDFRFREDFVGEEDSLLNGKICLKNPRFGYVCQRGVRYNYRKRNEKNSLVDTAKFKPESFRTVVELLQEIIPKERIEHYHKEIIIYEIRSRLKTIKEELFDNKIEYNKVIKDYKKFIQKIDINYVVYRSKFCDSVALKHFFCKTIDEEFNSYNYPNEFYYFYKLMNVEILSVSTIKDTLVLEVSFHTLNETGVDLIAFDGNNSFIQPDQRKDYNSFYDLSLGEFCVDKTHINKFVFDLKINKIIKFIIKDYQNNICIPPKHVLIGNKTCLNSCLKKINYGKYEITFNGRRLKIIKHRKSKIDMLKRKLKELLKIFKLMKALPIIRIFSRKKKKYILINDRINIANDNGEALFRYIYNSEPNIAKNTYFVISKKCDDYKQLKKIGKVVNTRSLRHKLLFLNAKYIYSSHTMQDYYFAFTSKQRLKYSDLFNYKFIWLQHGITINDISAAANRYRKGIDYVITASKDERKEFLKEKYGFENDKIILSGFSRYDRLENNSENIISIVPTWRRGLGEMSNLDDDFIKTDYFINYKILFEDINLNRIIKENNLKINFILHPEMIKYKKYFEPFANELIKIYEPNEINYSEIFKISKLLITDYSSVFFDFSYLKKPVIYYQFDREYFFSKHYKKGYFDYYKDGFGDVLVDCNSVINKIDYYIKNNFEMEQKYINRINKTFAYHDKNNSKRIIEATYDKSDF